MSRTLRTLIVTAHDAADCDAFSSIYCAARLLGAHPLVNRVHCLWPGSPDPMVAHLATTHLAPPGASLWSAPEALSEELAGDEQPKIVVFVDVRSVARVSHMRQLYPTLTAAREAGRARFLVVDHHPSVGDDIPSDHLVHRPYGSCTSILVEGLQSAFADTATFPREWFDPEAASAGALSLTPREAALLAIGIYDDTGSFTYSSTTGADLRAVAALTDRFQLDYAFLSDFIHGHQHRKDVFSPEAAAAFQQLESSAQQHVISGVPVVVAEATMQVDVRGFNNVVQRFLEDNGHTVVFAIGQFGDRTSIVARKRKQPVDQPNVHVGAICRHFGGGGHECAASASLKDLSVPQITDELFAHLSFHLAPPSPAQSLAQLITRPAVTVLPQDTVADVLQTMRRFNLKKVPVVASPDHMDDRDPDHDHGDRPCIGIADRVSLERAVAHDFGAHAVDGFIDSDFAMLTLESSLDDAIKIVIRQQQRLIPVVDGGAVAGVLSRSDVMGMMLKDPARFPVATADDRNIAALISQRAPRDIVTFLKQAGALADEMGVRVFVVGGFVRDILLNRDNDDVDLVVDGGEGVAFADALGERYGSKVQHHRQFYTAVVTLKSGWKIDVATARLEYYPAPSVLPTVELSTLKMDLYRRDFSVNAMAVQLNPFGRLVDFFNSQLDLDAKVIRALHSMSFVDDPTRIFRAVRFESRYSGFRIARQTERHIKTAIRLGILERLSGSRLLHELDKIFDDHDPVACIDRLQRSFRVLELGVHPQLKRAERKTLAAAVDATAFFAVLGLQPKQQASRPRVLFLALTDLLHEPDFSATLERLNLADGRGTELAKARREAHKMAHQVLAWAQAQPPANSAVHALLAKRSPDAIAFSLALVLARADEPATARAKQIYADFLLHLQRTRLAINGNDLKSIGLKPGPEFVRILGALTDAVLDGRVPNDKAELLRMAGDL